MILFKNTQGISKISLFFFIIALGLFAIPLTESHAHKTLEREMKKIGREFRRANESDDPENIVRHLLKMQFIAEKVKEEMEPHDATEEKIKKFHEGMDFFISSINNSMQAVLNGDVEQTKELFERLKKMRQKYHKIFDVKEKKEKTE